MKCVLLSLVGAPLSCIDKLIERRAEHPVRRTTQTAFFDMVIRDATARHDPNIVCVPNMCAQSDAVRADPKPPKWLSAGHAKPARPDRCGVGMGGDYEVWFCREVTVDLWRRSGALVEARASVQALESWR